MRKKQLEILLQQIPIHPSPRPEIEQYTTPADIVAEILFIALLNGDVKHKRIIDLGCGTGRFAIGAKLLGASEVTAIDIDAQALRIARDCSAKFDVEIKFICKNIEELDSRSCGCYDTVFQNPPFGAQQPHADRKFLVTACKLGTVIYTLHLAHTANFIRRFIKDELNGEITAEYQYDFVIPYMFKFHTRPKVYERVIMFRIKSPRL